MTEIVYAVIGTALSERYRSVIGVIGVTAHRKVVARIPKGFHSYTLTARARRYAAHVIACVGVTGVSEATFVVSLSRVR